MCMDTLSNRLSSMDTLLLRVWSMPLSLGESGLSCFSTSLSPDVSSAMMGRDVYAPMSTIKQSLEGVMSDQVETLWVDFISVEWQLGNTRPPNDVRAHTYTTTHSSSTRVSSLISGSQTHTEAL